MPFSLLKTKLSGSLLSDLELVKAVQPNFLMVFAKKLPLNPQPKIKNLCLFNIELAFSTGADAIFLPNTIDIFPPNNKNIIYLKASKELSSALCGITREGHFDGVCTVVYRLLKLIKPKNLYLGEKDWQQILILK